MAFEELKQMAIVALVVIVSFGVGEYIIGPDGLNVSTGLQNTWSDLESAGGIVMKVGMYLLLLGLIVGIAYFGYNRFVRQA